MLAKASSKSLGSRTPSGCTRAPIVRAASAAAWYRSVMPRSFTFQSNATVRNVGTLIMAVGPGLFGLAHDLSGSYAASLCLCIGLQLASSLIILCAPRVVREPVSATERG